MGFWCPVMQYTTYFLMSVTKFINLQDNMGMEKQGEAFSPVDVPGLPTVL